MDLQALLENTLPGLGYEFVDLSLGNHGKYLQVFIDKPGGITVEDCVAVSNHLSRLLAVDLDYEYDRLEVSSPGLDRPLKKETDIERFRGEKAQLKLRVPVDGRRNVVGLLGELKNGILELEVDGAIQAFEWSNVDKARLVPAI
ncbi:MAG: ribosome maturation factor RimP [Betaproteobacteria bacterium RBG_19FT_COMBO_58_11]|nr:MAG: ribosome maturation factor RimP [Betaproteobacteria bacterium RBG_19FT_COMBO_58_11]